MTGRRWLWVAGYALVAAVRQLVADAKWLWKVTEP